MSLLKYIERLVRMDDLIRRHDTGTSHDFARKLGLNRAMLMENLREMRELGAKISYCHLRRTYQYDEEFTLLIGGKNGCRTIGYVRGGEDLNQLNSRFSYNVNGDFFYFTIR